LRLDPKLSNEQTFPNNRKVHIFRPTGGGIFLNPYRRTERMSQQIFDQDRPRSTMAKRLDEAFAGCDEWTVIAAPRRRSTLDSAPTTSHAAPFFDGAALLQTEEAEAL
jgi:hypothetical protein